MIYSVFFFVKSILMAKDIETKKRDFALCTRSRRHYHEDDYQSPSTIAAFIIYVISCCSYVPGNTGGRVSYCLDLSLCILSFSVVIFI